MIVLVGESASGKDTIKSELINKHQFENVIKITTRPPRIGEKEGVEYLFESESRFKKLAKEGFFYIIEEYNGWFYGIPKRNYSDDSVIIATPSELRKLKNSDLHIISFYLKVPRRDRVIKSLQRGDDIEETYRRSLSDVGQFIGIEDEVTFVIENAGYEKDVDYIAEEILYLLD